MIKSVIRDIINYADKYLCLRALMRDENAKVHSLAGDRAIEWSWVTVRLPAEPCRVLDLGCVGSVLTGIASRQGHYVTAVDLNEIEYEMPNVVFQQGDIIEMNWGDAQFDIIMNCSMIEHVGLGGRYGSRDRNDGDIIAMKRLHDLLATCGRMILTIPVGIDAEFRPFHRVYGEKRLPLLLSCYNLIQEEYWHKAKNSKWGICDKQTALNTVGSAEFYSLGLFLLGK
ncbi:MAG: class I SAM-dependent methyltransferase [Sedimentisphaerales bacterium]|nr:class I SAM-dependent methyltransferase [Sedimentisphaerales bacterium]